MNHICSVFHGYKKNGGTSENDETADKEQETGEDDNEEGKAMVAREKMRRLLTRTRRLAAMTGYERGLLTGLKGDWQ